MGYVDNEVHCILVIGENRKHGIIVNSEGSDYARYSALLPNVDAFLVVSRYPAIAELVDSHDLQLSPDEVQELSAGDATVVKSSASVCDSGCTSVIEAIKKANGEPKPQRNIKDAKHKQKNKEL